MKEFTPPPPALLEHQAQQREYIIINKDGNSESAALHEGYNKEEFVPQAGLAKNRMKQYLDAQQNNDSTRQNDTGELVGKGNAKNLLAKWKSMEHMDEKEGAGRLSKEGSPSSSCINEEGLVEQGHARNLRAKWQNIDANGEQQQRPRRQITPPPQEELLKNRGMFENPQEAQLNKTVNSDQELMTIGRGHARNALAK
jgi:hypothetical protein